MKPKKLLLGGYLTLSLILSCTEFDGGSAGATLAYYSVVLVNLGAAVYLIRHLNKSAKCASNNQLKIKDYGSNSECKH